MSNSAEAVSAPNFWAALKGFDFFIRIRASTSAVITMRLKKTESQL